MPGMRHRVSGRDCPCCSQWAPTRASEKREVAAEITSEMIDAEIERWRPGLDLMAKWPEEDL